MFSKLLIANRGEIACRIMRTAKRMGIRTVAVFSDADAKALHVEMADEAVHIGTPPARDSYLRIDRIIDAAQRTGAQAIHPGYGFLSENADFADACAAAGIVFVGPSPAAIRAMGSKAEAKRLMQAAGVPLVPGYHGEGQSEGLLEAEAERIGFPVLIKASAGGGGRGMRAVHMKQRFALELAAARREAEAAFGDGRVLLEKYLQRPRHIEVQLLGDTHGTLLHLGTRDCSIQRRHQKIVEEAPAPGLSDATRERIHQAALAAGRAVNYSNAGTVEFIAEGLGPDPDFYFMEMNTRLQVEHPVTEQIYDVDLVQQQLRVAAGERLTLRQDELVPRGHAIELRLCAEDPDHDFRPTAGTFKLRLQDEGVFGWRTDSGYRSDFYKEHAISSHYDNLIAKMIVDALTREGCLEFLAHDLAEARVTGLVTNLALLRRIVAHPAFQHAELDTGFIERHRDTLLPRNAGPPETAWAAAALMQARWASSPAAITRWGPPSAWVEPTFGLAGFRLQGFPHIAVLLHAAGETRALKVECHRDQLAIDLGGRRFTMKEREWSYERSIVCDGVQVAVSVHLRDGELEVVIKGDPSTHRFRALDPYAPPDAAAAASGRIAAPIPALVTRVDVAPGDAVTRGQVLAVLEAMKTEIRITAPADGVVATVLVAAGQQVAEGVELVVLGAEAKA
jgi:3-methylcrotonyl-CoA carboxylase alpha subunit